MSWRFKRNVALFVLSAVAGGLFYWAVSDPVVIRRETPIDLGEPISEIPPFELENAHGGTLGRDDLLGRYWIADLIYTNCSAECPMMTRRMSRLQESLPGGEADDVRLVSISVDPRNDTATILRDYAAKERANPQRWHFLRGDEETVRRLATEGFKVGWSPDDPLQHSQRLVLVDPLGRVRGLYHAAEDDEIDRLHRDLAWLREHEPAGAAEPDPAAASDQ
jgi:protein SCO1/2